MSGPSLGRNSAVPGGSGPGRGPGSSLNRTSAVPSGNADTIRAYNSDLAARQAEGQDGLGELPPQDQSRRESLEAQANGHGPPTLMKPSADAQIAKDTKWTEDRDLEEQREEIYKQNTSLKETLWLAFKGLGIVYGDIGTSPLYVFNNIFVELRNPTSVPSKADVMGATSLVLWTIILIVFIKYALIVMRADDNGEGGTFALFSLLSRSARINTPARMHHDTDLKLRSFKIGPFQHNNSQHGPRVNEPEPKWKPPNRTAALLHNNTWLSAILLIIVLGATAMVIGDGILTPAQSVLAAISGLGSQNQRYNVNLSKGVIVGISCAVLAFLYIFQWVGTNHLGWAFSPIIVLWLLFNLIIGIYNIVHWHPGIFAALSPHYCFKFLVDNGKQGWVMLGGVLLCVTGAEAMFADLGHFTRKSIQVGLFVVLLPSLLFTYLGQAAYLIQFPTAVSSVYYNSLPHPVYWPMFAIATLASIVASQAMITAAFSIIRQSMTLGCFPRLRVIQTNSRIRGQIYIPEINYLLMVLSIAAVGGFQTLDRIGSAYGVAVTFVFFITDILFALVMLVVWQVHWFWPLLFLVFFGTLDGVYLSATLNKFTHGGWFPIAVAFAIFLISAVWSWGQRHRHWFLEGNDQKPLYEFLRTDPPDAEYIKRDSQAFHGVRAGANENQLSLRRSSITGKQEAIARISGMVLMQANSIQGTPPVFEHLLTNLPAMYKICVFVTVRAVPVPKVDDDERYLITELEYPGFYRCVCRYGYMESVDLGHAYEQHMVDAINKLSKPRAEWPSFREAMYHQVQKGKVEAAQNNKVVYVMGRLEMVSSDKINFIQKFLLEWLYNPMERNCRTLTDSWKIPRARLIEVGMTYSVGELDQGDPAWGIITNSSAALRRPSARQNSE